MAEMFSMKCYQCLCSVCNMRKCPRQWHRNHEALCQKSCWNNNRLLPRLDCDFFEHFLKQKHYRVKRRITQRPLYSSEQVGEMFEKILKKIEVDENE